MHSLKLNPMARGNGVLVICLLLVYVIWGSTYLGIKTGVEGGMPPFMMAGSRYFCAGALLFAGMKLRGAAWPSARQWRNALLMGFLMVSMGNGMVCLAAGHISSSASAIIYASGPVIALVISRFMGDRPARIEWLGVVLGVAGVVLLHLDHTLLMNWRGSLAVLVASASMSFAVILQPQLDMPKGGLSAPAQMMGGAVCLLPLALLRGEAWPAQVPASAWLAFAYLTVFGSIVAYSAYVYVLNHATPALATSNEYVNAIVAVLLGHALGREAVSGSMLAGMAAILGGVVLIAVSHVRRPSVN